MRAMIALQKQEKSWLSFDHQIAMIDYFKLDLGTADQLTDMKYVVDGNDDEGVLV